MANRLLIMRHAQSESVINISDFDRPLDSHGLKEPKSIAKQLDERGINIDYALISPSERTTKTFKLLSSAMKSPPKVIADPRIYKAQTEDLIDIIGEHDLEKGTLLIVGHNPSVSHVIFELTRTIVNLKPAQLVVLKAKNRTNAQGQKRIPTFVIEEILDP